MSVAPPRNRSYKQVMDNPFQFMGVPAEEDTRQVDATVVAVIPEFKQVRLRSSDGDLFAVTEWTKGVYLGNLQEGQRLRCTVTRNLPRVLRAELLA